MVGVVVVDVVDVVDAVVSGSRCSRCSRVYKWLNMNQIILHQEYSYKVTTSDIAAVE